MQILPFLKKRLCFSIIAIIILSLSQTAPVAAQDTTNDTTNQTGGETGSATACAITKIGNPPGAQPPLPPECQLAENIASSNYATKVVKAVTDESTCTPTNIISVIGSLFGFYKKVLKSNINCLNSVDGNKNGLQNWTTVRESYFKTSATNYGALQCVGFVQGILQGAHGKPLTPSQGSARLFGSNYSTYSNDYKWFPNKPENLNNMKPGDVVVFNGTTDGHIAIIIKSNPPGNGKVNFTVAEGNGNSNGEVMTHNYNTGTSGGLNVMGWFRKI